MRPDTGGTYGVYSTAYQRVVRRQRVCTDGGRLCADLQSSELHKLCTQHFCNDRRIRNIFLFDLCHAEPAGGHYHGCDRGCAARRLHPVRRLSSAAAPQCTSGIPDDHRSWHVGHWRQSGHHRLYRTLPRVPGQLYGAEHQPVWGKHRTGGHHHFCRQHSRACYRGADHPQDQTGPCHPRCLIQFGHHCAYGREYIQAHHGNIPYCRQSCRNCRCTAGCKVYHISLSWHVLHE